MPIYEYECRKCKAHTEVYQKINDKPRTRCPKCKGRLDKLMSASAVHFKGTGWYVTDYAGKGKGAEHAEEKTSSPAAEVATTTDKPKGKETKPAKKASAESTASNKPSEKT